MTAPPRLFRHAMMTCYDADDAAAMMTLTFSPVSHDAMPMSRRHATHIFDDGFHYYAAMLMLPFIICCLHYYF